MGLSLSLKVCSTLLMFRGISRNLATRLRWNFFQKHLKVLCYLTVTYICKSAPSSMLEWIPIKSVMSLKKCKQCVLVVISWYNDLSIIAVVSQYCKFQYHHFYYRCHWNICTLMVYWINNKMLLGLQSFLQFLLF